ncbi:MAG: thioesterase family protein [Acidimicrobiales bacterium]
MGRAWDSTAVEGIGPGRYRAQIDDVWTLAMVPMGGVVLALAARALAAELGTGQPLRTIHGVFASPVHAGPVEAEVRVLRRGRSASQAAVDLGAPGAPPGFSALAVFGGDRPGFEFTELRPPAVPDPEGLASFRDPPPPEGDPDGLWEGPWPLWAEVLEGRAALGHPWWDRSPRGAAEVANWMRFDDQPLSEDGMLDPFALLVMADMMPGAVFERIGPTGERWFSPSADLTVHLFGHATPGWILAHAKAHHAGDGYASAEMALWDPRGDDGPRLVAWACQQMLFTRMAT